MAARGDSRRPRPGRPRARRRAPRVRPPWFSPLKWLLGVLCLAIGLLGANFLYQVIRKPTELFFPVSGVLYKTPQETWDAYAGLFHQYATAHISAPLLAALAQVEASGNPLARTYWRWAWAARPFDFYRPASSAVGLYQITDPTFAIARHYCIHDHQVVQERPWNDWHACWFNALYLRALPRDAVELTAAYLELKVAMILQERGSSGASTAQVQHLAAVVHLCGAGAGALYARRGFHFRPGERCGDQDPREYLERVEAYRLEFTRLAAREAAAAAQ